MSPRFRINILVVEDSTEDFDLIAHAVAESGFAAGLARAHDGIEAIEYLTGQGAYGDRTIHVFPDVMMMDLKMPRMDGFELLTWIGNHPANRVIPAIVMSSSSVPDDVERAYALGAHSYFVKPIAFEEFTDLFKLIAAYWTSALTPASAKRGGA
jgi:CheY-like chemotaxis protein